MPSPRAYETKKAFIGRCMASPEQRKSFPDQKQRAAVCFSKWREHLKKSSYSEEEIAQLEKSFNEDMSRYEKEKKKKKKKRLDKK